MQQLIEKTIDWANERNLLGDGANLYRQVLKFGSEAGEFMDEVAKGDTEKAKMELGDVLVTAILSSKLMGFTLEEALEAAYTKISNRKGKTVNGVFIKDEAA